MFSLFSSPIYAIASPSRVTYVGISQSAASAAAAARIAVTLAGADASLLLVCVMLLLADRGFFMWDKNSRREQQTYQQN